MSGKSRMAVESISCPVFMIDIDMCPVVGLGDIKAKPRDFYR